MGQVKLNSAVILIFLLTTSLIVFCYGTSDSNSRHHDHLEEEDAIQKWEENFRKIKKVTGTVIKTAMPYFMTAVSSENLHLSAECRRALLLWVSDLRSLKPWALRMVDASAKMMNGILTGTLSAFGSFDQCVEISVPNRGFRGQYCSIEAWPPLPPKPRFYALNQRLKAFEKFENDTGVMGEFTKYVQLFYMFPFRIGVCVPSACSTSDVFNVSSFAAQSIFPANISVPRCETKEVAVVQYYQIPMLCVIGVLIILVLCGTLVDALIIRKKNVAASESGLVMHCLLAFSAISNFKKLMDVNAASDALTALHGIRFYSMCWIILGHTYFHLNFGTLRYLQITIEMASQFAFNFITNSSLVVDNFFFLSGLLMIYVALDMEKKTGRIPDAVHFIIHRLWRFLPVQMFFVGVSTLLPLVGDGPVWRENIEPITKGCRNDWWTNLIFINNLYRSSPKGCLSHAWYLAADFQIYVFCIPIVILIVRKPRIGLWVNFTVIMLSILAVGIHNYIRDFPPTLLFTHADFEQRNQLMMEIYYPPYQHLGPFCIGIFVGYYLRIYRSKLKMHWVMQTFLWALAFMLLSSTLFGVHAWNSGTGATGVVATVLYASLSRAAWTVGLAWITLATSTDGEGFLSCILRWKPLIPLSRLTFLAYMIHPLLQHTLYATLRESIQARNHLAIFVYLGFVTGSYILAAVLCLLLEAPFINLGKIIFETKTKQDSSRKRKDTPEQVEASWKSGPLPQIVSDAGKINSDINYCNNSESLGKDTRDGFICHL